MVRPFRHPVNAADRPRHGPVIEDKITVKGCRLLPGSLIAISSNVMPRHRRLTGAGKTVMIASGSS
jgi:hypothetical protein